MRVAIYAGMFKENQDGATKTLYRLVNHLLEQDIEVGVWGFSMTALEKDKLKLFTIPSLPLPFYKDYRITISNPRTFGQIEEFQPDIVHVTVPDLTGQLFTAWGKKRGIPVISSYHTDFISYLPSYKLGGLKGTVEKYFRFFYNQTAAVYAPTSQALEQLEGYGVKNLKIWGRGIDSREFSPSRRSVILRKKWKAEGKRVILFAGRFVWYKGLDTFTKIYKQMSLRKDVKFVLAGDGPIREELEKRMPDAVFTGYIKGDLLSQVYASSDIFLFPSTTETFGNVVQEALASGLPAVVSDIGGCKEIVGNSGGGLIAEAENPIDFTAKCRQLIENPFLYSEKKALGLEYVSQNSWDKINHNLVKDYYTYIDEKTDLKCKIPPKTYT